MASCLQSRVLSGRLCSTSGCSHKQEHRPGSCLILRAESIGRQAPPSQLDGWSGNSCFLQRRPNFPRASATPDVSSMGTGVSTPSPNGKRIEIYDSTEFVAETLLPTVQGKYRVRAYRHSVCASSASGMPTGFTCQGALPDVRLLVAGGRLAHLH